MGKTLIAYYSRRGENYVNGSIKKLKLGNTEVVAQKIKALLPLYTNLRNMETILRVRSVNDNAWIHRVGERHFLSA